MNRHCASYAGALALVALLARPVSVEAADDPARRATADAELICLTEQPAIVEGENATLRAWASTSDGRAIDTLTNFKWEVNAGRIEAQAAATKWDLSAVRVGLQPTRRVVATATATQTDGRELRCAVEIFIDRQQATIPKKGTDRGPLLSARRYLLPGEVEAPGFGLYSYLLFSAPPKGPEEKARYLKTIEASLLVLQEVDDYLSRHVPPSRLNATYIPVKKTPDRGESDTQWAENVLAVYDYTAAQILLNSVQQSHQQGPYLLSVLKRPADAGTSAHLWEDFTGLVPELAWERIRLFTYLAAQERSWSEDSLKRFGLKLRNLIAVGGKVTPDVMKGLERAIPVRSKG